MSICCHLFVCVPLCNPKIYNEVEQAEDGQKPVEVVKMAPIQIVRYPTKPSMACGDFCYNNNKKSAKIITQGISCEWESCTQASHSIKRLTIKELYLTNVSENFCSSYKEILRHLPEDWQWDGFKIIVVVFPNYIKVNNL